MPTAAGVRITWRDLPRHVRVEIERILGSRVVSAVSQSGGFSPGTADRVRTADGRGAFVKAVNAELNERTPELHRREALVAGGLPVDPRIPELLGTYDDGDWVCLVLEDIDGRHPCTPWVADEIDAVLNTLTDLSRALTPSPLLFLESAAESLAHDLAGWDRVASRRPAGLDPWAADHVDLLIELSERGRSALAGDTLVHTDVRADNLLIRRDGTVAVVDWPWACVGPAWLDVLLLLVNVNLFGGHDVDALLATHAEIEEDVTTAMIAALAGYFTDVAHRPAPTGLPTVRQFQAYQAVATLAWLRRRL